MLSSQSLIKKRIIIFGANGMLGQRTAIHFRQRGDCEIMLSDAAPDAIFPDFDYQQTDLTDREQVKSTILKYYPDVIINAAAYTNVDASETDRATAWKVNVQAVEFMSEAARVLDSHIVHISTDYVFDGLKGYYLETDKPNPLGYYGRTKLASENALRISGTMHSILRTNVLYGIITTGRKDFVRWVVDSIRAGSPIRIVTDQINNPTYLDDLVDAIDRVITYRKFGLYHIGGNEFLSRYEFTMRIADYFHLDPSLITPITTDVLMQPAKRPLKSGLINLKAESEFGYRPTPVEETFKKMKVALNL